MLIDRKGRVDMVLVGEAGGILIPELPRARSGADRLRGLRLLHTHLTPDGLSQEDLMDLLFLRLDAIIVLTVNPDGDPVQWQEAHLLPTPVAGQPYRVEQLRPWDQTSAHFAATAEALEEELARRSDDTREASDAPRALLVSVAAQPRIIQERNLDELAELARTAGLAVAGRMVQRVAQVNPKFILGKGKMAELEVLALEGRAGTLVFDGELSPAQLHNLADITERKVLDRTQLILEDVYKRQSWPRSRASAANTPCSAARACCSPSRTPSPGCWNAVTSRTNIWGPVWPTSRNTAAPNVTSPWSSRKAA